MFLGVYPDDACSECRKADDSLNYLPKELQVRPAADFHISAAGRSMIGADAGVHGLPAVPPECHRWRPAVAAHSVGGLGGYFGCLGVPDARPRLGAQAVPTLGLARAMGCREPGPAHSTSMGGMEVAERSGTLALSRDLTA